MNKAKRYSVVLDIYSDIDPTGWDWDDLLRPEWNEFLLRDVKVQDSNKEYCMHERHDWPCSLPCPVCEEQCNDEEA